LVAVAQIAAFAWRIFTRLCSSSAVARRAEISSAVGRIEIRNPVDGPAGGLEDAGVLSGAGAVFPLISAPFADRLALTTGRVEVHG